MMARTPSVRFSDTDPPPQRPIKTTVYLPPDLMAQLDDLRSRLRREGHRSASQNGLVQAAIELAGTDTERWLEQARRAS
jgi:hypothetical protein